MGRLSVRVAERRSGDVKVVAVYVEHANGGKESTQVLRMGKKGSLPVSALQEPFLFFEAFPESTLVVEWGTDLSSRQLKKDFVSLDTLPLGRDELVSVGDTVDGLMLEVCSFNFGAPPLLVDKRSTFATDELFGNLFSRSVCDVELLELRDVAGEGAVGASGGGAGGGVGGGGVGAGVAGAVGGGLRKLHVQVCFDTGTIVFHTPQVECATSVRLIDQDCSFLFGGDADAEAPESVEADEEAEVLLTISLFEKKLSREHLVGAVTLDLRRLVHIKGAAAAGQYPHLWLALTRKQETVGWLKCRVAVSMEGDREALLARFGAAVRSLPMRVNTGDLILMHNASAMAKFISAATGCLWDHVALVVCGPEPWRRPMLMEATKEGVLAYPFEERVEAILRTEAVLGLRRLLQVERSDAFIRQVQNFVAAHHGKNYEESVATLIRARFKAGANQQESLESLFCSELVAAAYQELGIIGREVISSNYSPKDFAVEHFATQHGHLDEIKRHVLRANVIEHDIEQLDNKMLRKTAPVRVSPPAQRRTGPTPTLGMLGVPQDKDKASTRHSPRAQPKPTWQVGDLDKPLSLSDVSVNASFHLSTGEGREWMETLASPGPVRPTPPRPLSQSAERRSAASVDKSPLSSPRNSSGESWARATPAPQERGAPLIRKSSSSKVEMAMPTPAETDVTTSSVHAPSSVSSMRSRETRAPVDPSKEKRRSLRVVDAPSSEEEPEHYL